MTGIKEFKRRVYAVNIYGTEYNISFPTVKQSQDYATLVNKVEEAETTDCLLGFLEGLGLPKDVSFDMEAEHLTTLIEALVPSQKK